MRLQRLLFAIGAGLFVVFLIAGVVAMARPDAVLDPLSSGGTQLLRSLLWLASGLGIGLFIRWAVQGKE